MPCNEKTAQRFRISKSGHGPFPAWLILLREDLLNQFGFIRYIRRKHFQRPIDLGNAWVRTGGLSVSSPPDSIENGRQIEKPASCFQEVLFESTGSGKWVHDRSIIVSQDRSY